MEQLIAKAQSGDDTALNSLWESVERFAYTVARRYVPTAYADTDDFMQCAWLGFRSAVVRHDGRFNFLRLVGWYVQHECRTLLGLRNQKSPRHALPLDALAEDGETPYVEMLGDSSIPPSSAAMEDTDLYRDVHAAVSALPEREKLVVGLHYFDGITFESIAQRLQVSTQRATQIKDNALAHLRNDPVLSAAYAPDFRTTPDTKHNGLRRFMLTHTSVTEHAAIQRMSLRKRTANAQYAKYQQWMRLNVSEGIFTQEEADSILAQKRQALGLQPG